jgi:hypothetical protein
MTRFEPEALPSQQILNTLRERHAESTLVELIDQPIELAVMTFACPEVVSSQREFLDHLARFLQHVYAEVQPRGRQPTAEQARGEAVSLLEQGGFPQGYRGAWWEASHAQGPGIPGILFELASFLVARHRESHERFVYSSVLDDLDWKTKCALSRLILEKWRDRKPPELSAASVERYANYLPLLVQRDLQYRPYRSDKPHATARR